MNMTNN